MWVWLLCAGPSWGDQAVLRLFLILLSGLWLAQAWLRRDHHRGTSKQAHRGSQREPLVACVHKQHVGAQSKSQVSGMELSSAWDRPPPDYMTEARA